VNKLRTNQRGIAQDLDNYRFSEAYDKLYHFVWDDLADWYIEASKAIPNTELLSSILESVLILAHPFAPFVTETIWQTLAWQGDSILAKQLAASPIAYDKNHAESFEQVKSIVTEARYITKALKVRDASLVYEDDTLIEDSAPIIQQLAYLKMVRKSKKGSDEKGLYLTSTRHSCWLDIDVSKAKSYVEELVVKKAAQQRTIEQLEARLKNKNYVKNAPEKIVTQTINQVADAKELLESLSKEEERFSSL
jgi:valyl-tRNA synthetase